MAQETFTKEQFWAELDALGEAEVHIRMSVNKTWGHASEKLELAKIWLSRIDSAKRDAREERTLAIAEEANSIAKEALATAKEQASSASLAAAAAFEQARWAKWAAIIATVAAAIATVAAIK